MIATNPDALLADANSMQKIPSELDALRVEIYLLQQIAASSLTAQQLITAANQYQIIPDKQTARQVIIYLLAQIVNIV